MIYDKSHCNKNKTKAVKSLQAITNMHTLYENNQGKKLPIKEFPPDIICFWSSSVLSSSEGLKHIKESTFMTLIHLRLNLAMYSGI